MNIDWDRLKAALLSNFVLDETSLHGLTHWETVEDYAVRIAQRNGANVDVVRLFAYFHDACRQTDEHDLTHGTLGAKYAEELRGNYFDLPDEDFELLCHACKWHTHGKVTDEKTIGACWDADRLDLGRVGVIPKSYYFSTKHAIDILENS